MKYATTLIKWGLVSCMAMNLSGCYYPAPYPAPPPQAYPPQAYYDGYPPAAYPAYPAYYAAPAYAPVYPSVGFSFGERGGRRWR